MLKKSYWLIIFILLSVISVNAESQQPKPYNQPIEQKANQTKDKEKISNSQNRDTTKSLPLEPSAPPLDLKKAISDKGKYSQDDPDKKWADIKNSPVGIFTGIIAIFTILLVAAGFYQAAVTRAATRKQLRAYVFVETMDVLNVTGNAPPPIPGQPPPQVGPWIYRPDIGPAVMMIIKNTGQTPAYDVVHYGNLCVAEYRPSPNLPPQIHIPTATKVAIPPDGKTSKFVNLPQPLTDDEINQLRTGTHAIYLFGRITYKDIFNKKRFTNFRFFHNGFVGILGQITTVTGCEEGNEAN